MKIRRLFLAVLTACVMAICFTSCNHFAKTADIVLKNDLIEKTDGSSVTLYGIELYKDSSDTPLQVYNSNLSTGGKVRFSDLNTNTYYWIGGYIKSHNSGPYIFITERFYLEESMTYSMYEHMDSITLYGINDANIIAVENNIKQAAISFDFAAAE